MPYFFATKADVSGVFDDLATELSTQIKTGKFASKRELAEAQGKAFAYRTAATMLKDSNVTVDVADITASDPEVQHYANRDGGF